MVIALPFVLQELLCLDFKEEKLCCVVFVHFSFSAHSLDERGSFREQQERRVHY